MCHIDFIVFISIYMAHIVLTLRKDENLWD